MTSNKRDEGQSDYDNMINKLTQQIEELFFTIHYYQGVIAQKDNYIKQLTIQNNQLRVQIQNLQQSTQQPVIPPQQSYTPPMPKITLPELKAPIHSNQQINPPPIPGKQAIAAYEPSEDSRGMKRQCPNCGASGFAIQEIEDKSRLLSYVPKLIYAKKKHCTKCGFEW